MARSDYLFTSESVSEGHPDKVSDRISDEVVDLFFREGPKEGMSPWDIRAACETLCTTNRVVIAGETRGPKSVGPKEVEAVARAAIKDIGYEQDGFHWDKANRSKFCCTRSRPTSHRASTPSGNKDEGAGDQGIMFGYACRETPGPDAGAACITRTRILQGDVGRRVIRARRKMLGPDAKSQVTIRYENGKPVEATQIVVSHPASRRKPVSRRHQGDR